MWNDTCNWPRSRLVYSLYGAGQHVVSLAVSRKGVGKHDDERKTEPVMGEALRFFVVLYPILGLSRRRWKRRRWKEAVGRKEEYTKYGGKRDEATRIQKEEADEGRRETRRGWDEKFSLASLRCLYTRGSCIAMGHISVLRERGAPPKNQIECKNRINSSCKLESYVCPVGSLSKLSLFLFLFSFSLRSFSFLYTLYLKFLFSFSAALLLFFFTTRSTSTLAWLHLEERPITSYIFFYSTCLPARKLCG